MSNINNKKYLIKEKLHKKFDIDYSLLDPSEELSESEINAIVDEIAAVPETLTLKPFDASIIPLGKNSDSTKDLFNRRKYYKKYALPDTSKNLNEVDGNTVDDTSNYQGVARDLLAPFYTIDLVHNKSFYGRIDTNNRSIYPSEKFLKLVNGTQDVMLLDFVAEAANDMIEKINRMVNVGKISKKSSYSDFIPKKGWTSFTKEHHKSMNKVFEIFIGRYATSKKFFTKIYDFSSYITHFTNFLDLFLPAFPITRSNMQISSHVNPGISGIVFEIAPDKHDEDENKYRTYILDKNFIDICKIANGFGFYIDKNAPWRFVADLDSPQMLERMQSKGFNTLQSMFEGRYYDTHLYEINALRDYFLSFYDSYVEAYPYYSKTHACGDGSKAKLLYRAERGDSPFTNEKLLEFYFYVRCKEGNLDISQSEFEKLVREAVEIFNNYGFVQSLHFIVDKTTNIRGLGGNFGNNIEITEKNRIFSNHASYYKSNSFKFKL